MSSCLVIGANGFIGSHLVDALVLRGHTVTAFDRFSSGAPTYSAEGVRMVVGDFLNFADLSNALDDQELVFHFLSTTSPATSDDEPILDLRTNVTYSVDFFRLCVEKAVGRVYFASTGGAIYGDQGLAQYQETDRCLPVSPYAIGKLTLEHYLRYFRNKHGLESVSLRISNPYGPRQHPHRRQGFIPIALRHIADHEPVGRFGDGSMIRDYIYVEDAAHMIARIAGTVPAFPLYNIGSGVGHSVNEVLAVLGDVTELEFSVEDLSTPPTYVKKVVLDTSRYENEFGPSTFRPLVEGVRATWDAFKSSPRGSQH